MRAFDSDRLSAAPSPPEPARRALLRGLGAVSAAIMLGRSALAAAKREPFRTFLLSLEAPARKAGISSETFQSAVAGLAPDPVVATRAAAQPEFETPIWTYVEKAAGPQRAARGRSAAAQWSPELEAIARRSGVPSSVVLAAWGMEADFTEPAQTRDVLRSLATLAWLRPQTPIFRTEFIAALDMLQRRLADRARLQGSWAGAMGMPQFMPSAYLRYAVSFRGDGPPDIWTSVPDALASIANFFARSGWTRGLPWGCEVILPHTFAWTTLRGDFADWRRLGLRRADDAPLPPRGAAALFAPAGAAGPAFLLSDNFWIIKLYDNSDAYALSLGLLADAVAGEPGLSRPWPRDVRMLGRDERIHMQKSLAALGLYRGAADGKVGPATREAVHSFELAAGLHPADGFPTLTVLAALERRSQLR